MPRKLKPSDIQKLRQKNYLHYLEIHNLFTALAPDLKVQFEAVSRLIGKPAISLVGECQDGTWALIAKVASAHRIHISLWDMIHPYANDEGWKIYRSMFEQLPEPVDMPILVEDWPMVEIK